MAEVGKDQDVCKQLSELKLGDNSLTKLSKKLASELEERRRRILAREEELERRAKKRAEIERNILELKKKIKEKEEEISKLESEENEADPYKYEAKLYRMITKVTWDLDCPEGFIAGYTTRGGLKSFKIDTRKHSQYFITNYLWNLISGDENTPPLPPNE